MKVLQNVRFRPALDEGGKPIEASIDMKVEMRPSTGSMPKPVAAKPDPQLTEKEKARIRKMKCSDFRWEWDLIQKEADDATATEFMPRIATAMYAAHRTEQGEYVDAKVWKASPKALQEAARNLWWHAGCDVLAGHLQAAHGWRGPEVSFPGQASLLFRFI